MAGLMSGLKAVATALLLSALILLLLGNDKAGAREGRRVIILETMDAPIVQRFTEAFIGGLKERVEEPLELVRLNARGNRGLGMALLKEALTEDTELVVAVATLAAEIAHQHLQGKQLPLLFMCVTDPVGAGLVETVGQPTGANITGKAFAIPAATKLEMVMNIARQMTTRRPIRFGYLHTDYPADKGDLKRLLAASRERSDLLFVPQEIDYRPLATHRQQVFVEMAAAAEKLQQEIDFWWAPRGILAVLKEHDEILLATGVPFLVGATEESVRRGALLEITGDPQDQGFDTALIAAQILAGKAAGEIAVSLPGKIQLSINLDTARALGVVIPSAILTLAGSRTYTQ